MLCPSRQPPREKRIEREKEPDERPYEPPDREFIVGGSTGDRDDICDVAGVSDSDDCLGEWFERLARSEDESRFLRQGSIDCVLLLLVQRVVRLGSIRNVACCRPRVERQMVLGGAWIRQLQAYPPCAGDETD